MRFKVPQFIEIEDKIFGPLTFKQFVYLVGGGGLAFVLWRILPIFVSIFAVIPVIALALALAFYKPNNKPFVEMLEAAFKYLLGNKLYIWKHKDKKIEKSDIQKTGSDSLVEVPKLSQSKLKDLSWELDIHESMYTEDTKPE